MSIPLSILVALAAFAAPSPIPAAWSARERVAAEEVTAPALAAHVRFLADDLLEGRAPGSRGDELAMKYVAAEYERLGLEPAGDAGGWLQKFEIVGLKSHAVAPPTFRGAKGVVKLDPALNAVVAAGQQRESAKITDAEVVFVGYGITAPEQKWDDFKDVDVRGKVLLVMNNDPENDPALFAGKTRLYYGRWTYKYEEAARKGAAGAIIIHTTPSAGYPWQVVQSSWNGEDFELPAAGEPRLDAKMWATEDAARQIAWLGGQDLDALRARAERRDFRPVPLGVKVSVELATQVRRLQTANVLGVLRGGDPKLASELLVFSAHHDHLGVREAKNGDAIYNGALDNASGVSAMLVAAEALARAQPKPRRSILFAAVGVEESGLLGSEYLCQHPPVPAGRIAANINIDGANIWGRTRDLGFVGFGKSTLDDVVAAAAREQGRTLKPEAFPERGHFYRSDQFSFARIGVPAIYLDRGTDYVGRPANWGKERVDEYVLQRYHQPSDQIDATWNLDGAVDDVRLLAAVALRIADAAQLPAWRPGDEFEGARKKALGETRR
ncbi:MAG TPA: M28 family peptidase [Polyangia bacterium]|nr:M28 family peptidase [Polyangia bacterium]